MPDEIIDDAAIRIVPDFSQFRAEFDAQRTAIQATIKKLEIPVDTSGIGRNFQLRLKEMQRAAKEAADAQTRSIKEASEIQARVARESARIQQQQLRDVARAQQQADRDRLAQINKIGRAESAAYVEQLRRDKAAIKERQKDELAAYAERDRRTKISNDNQIRLDRQLAEERARLEEGLERRRNALAIFRRQHSNDREGRAFNLPFVSQSLPRRYALPIGLGAAGVAGGLLDPLLGGVASAVPVLTGAIPLLASLTGLLKDNATLAAEAGAGWRKFKDDTQSIDIQVLSSGVGVLNSFLEDALPLTTAVGKAFANTGNNIRDALQGPEFKQIFAGFTDIAQSGDVELAGHALTELAAAAGHAVIAFRPLIDDTVKGLDRFAIAVNRGSQSEGFRQFVSYVRTNGHILADLLRQVAGIFSDLSPIVGSFGRAALLALDAVAHLLHAITSTRLGELTIGLLTSIALFSRLDRIIRASTAFGFLRAAIISTRAELVGLSATQALSTLGSRITALASNGTVQLAALAAAFGFLMYSINKFNHLHVQSITPNPRSATGVQLNIAGNGSFDDASATAYQRQLIETASQARELGISVDGLNVEQRRAAISAAELARQYPGLTQAQAEAAVAADKLSAKLDQQVAVAQASRTIFDTIADNRRAQGQAQQDVIDAQVAVGAARRQAQDDVLQGARDERNAIESVAAANRGLLSAQAQQVEAQKALDAARKSAREQLISYRKEVRDTALAEKEAKLSLVDAQAALAQARHDPTSTPTAIAEAELAVQEATNKSKDSTDDRVKAVKTLNDAEKLGIERSPQVVAAKKAIRDADQAQQDAVRGVRDAEENLADVRKRNARTAITDAQNIRKAINDVMEKQLGYNDAVNVGTTSLDMSTAAGLKNIVMLTALAAALKALNENNPEASKAAFDLIARQAGFNPKTLGTLENTLFPASVGNGATPTNAPGPGGSRANFASTSGGGGGAGAAGASSGPANRDANKNLAHQKVNAMGWSRYWPSYDALEMGEAGYNNLAQNPTSSAYGIGQFLNSTWASVGGHKTSNPGLQIDYMLKYIKQRYGNPGVAYSTWLSRRPHWYSDGGSVKGAGGPREDKIAAWLSNGEYVINAKAHKAVGTATLDHINAQGYAAGGKVNTSAHNFELSTVKNSKNISDWITWLVQITGRGFRPLAQQLAAMDLNDFPTFEAAHYYSTAPLAELKRVTSEVRSVQILSPLLEKLPTILKNEPSPGPLRYSTAQLQAFAGLSQGQAPFTATNLLPPGGRVLYDTGGLLPAGGRNVQNNTGRPEAVLTEQQWQAIYSAATRNGVSVGDVHLHDGADVDMLVRKMQFMTNGGAA
jgi:hypothetical protein